MLNILFINKLLLAEKLIFKVSTVRIPFYHGNRTYIFQALPLLNNLNYLKYLVANSCSEEMGAV